MPRSSQPLRIFTIALDLFSQKVLYLTLRCWGHVSKHSKPMPSAWIFYFHPFTGASSAHGCKKNHFAIRNGLENFGRGGPTVFITRASRIDFIDPVRGVRQYSKSHTCSMLFVFHSLAQASLVHSGI